MEVEALDANTNTNEQDQVVEEQMKEPEFIMEQASVETKEHENVPAVFYWFSDRPAYSLEELSRTSHYMPSLATIRNAELQISFNSNMLANTATAYQKNWSTIENQRLIVNKVLHFMEIRNRHSHKTKILQHMQCKCFTAKAHSKYRHSCLSLEQRLSMLKW